MHTEEELLLLLKSIEQLRTIAESMAEDCGCSYKYSKFMDYGLGITDVEEFWYSSRADC